MANKSPKAELSPKNTPKASPKMSPGEDDAILSKKGWKRAVDCAAKKLADEVSKKADEVRSIRNKRKIAEQERTAQRKAQKAAEEQQAKDAKASRDTSDKQAKTVKVPSKPAIRKQDVKASVQVEKYRRQHEIIVDSACPDPFESFDLAADALGPRLLSSLRGQGYEAPTPIQAQAWPIVLKGQDLVAVAKTGSGKTCGFLLPAMVRISLRVGPVPVPKKIDKYLSEPAIPSTLVLAPTRELAQQIGTEANKFAFVAQARVVCIFGGVSKVEHLRELKFGVDILVATPGRLVDFAIKKPGNHHEPVVALDKVAYFVLDEADRMLDMGFEPDIRKIVGLCPEPGSATVDGPTCTINRQTLFFTATWPKAVESVARSLIRQDAVQIRIGQGAGGDKLTASKNVTQVVSVLDYGAKLAKLQEVLKNELKDGETAIVFASTKGGCDYLERAVQKSQSDVWCGATHSGKEQWERDETLAKFRALTAGEGKKRGVLVATDVAARGLDIPGVSMVIVYDFSDGRGNNGIESYVHRIGRTGRADKHGRAYTFFSPGEAGARDLVELLRGADQEVPKPLEDLAMHRKAGKGKGANGKGGKGSTSGKGGIGKSRDRNWGGRSSSWE